MLRMAESVPLRVQILPTSLDTERVGEILERTPDRVYILYNDEPKGMHEDLAEESRREIYDMVDERTMCGDADEIYEEGINFYEFEEALIESYRIIYEESLNDNQVMVNLSGGTKPVAIALAFACSLTEVGMPLYYVARGYEKSEGEVHSTGVVDEQFPVRPLQPLNITDVVPDDEEKVELAIQLLQEEDSVGITDLLAKNGLISGATPDDEEKKKNRQRKVQKYHRHAKQMFERDVLKREDSKYSLTESGELIARLVEVKKSVEAE